MRFEGKTGKSGATKYIGILSILVFMMAILAACTGKSAPETEEKPSAAAVEATASPVPQQNEAAPAKYDPPIELTTVSNSLSGATQFGEGEDMNNNSWTKYFLDEFGIKVNTLWLSPTSELEQKTNLMIASGDIPDFFLATPIQFRQLLSAGMIEDLTGAYEHASEAIKALITEAGPEVMQAVTVDNKIMGIPFTGSVKQSVPILWIREDWLKKVNLNVPTTMDEVLAVSAAFTNQDPDGNGKNDTYGIGLDKDFNMAFGMMNGYHAYPGIWIKDNNGKLVYSGIQPEMKTVLAKLHEMYEAGQIDKEFGVKDWGKVTESFGANKIGMFFGDISSATSPLSQQTPEQRWIPLPVPSIDSNPALLSHPLNITNGFWVVRKGVEHPEAILKLADTWIDYFYLNPSDEVYSKFVNSDGVSHWINAPVKLYKSYDDTDVSVHIAPLLTGDKEATTEQVQQLMPNERTIYNQIMQYRKGDIKMWYRDAKFGPVNSAASVINQYRENNQYISDQYVGIPTPSMIQKFANLQKMEMETTTKIILGTMPVDDFDRFVEEWKKLGGNDITNEINQ